ncbi:MAG TPA: MBL fold metallo-hydrolase [Candidatus Limnocylindrales bacterium]|nr:MBL fold metallo-hydrolase [Candidatus Limnocylindrales bacterium]
MIAVVVLTSLGFLACTMATDLKPPPPASSDPASLYAEHYEDGEFFNPWNRFDYDFTRFVRMVFSRNPFDDGHEPQIPFHANDGAELSGVQSSTKITWVGHATAAIHDGDDVVLTDPNWAPRMLVVRRHHPPGIPLEAVPADAMAVISHNHNDHLDAGTVDRLPDTVKWFVPMGMAEWFRERGRNNVVELDWWQSARHGRWTMTCLPAQHWSRRVGQGFNEALWCSWLMDSGTMRYYFGGDTGYFHGFAEYGRRFGPIDVALLPIGAYEPRWFMGYQHVNPAEAYRAFRDLRARYMIPVHWGTFDLAMEALDQPPKELMTAVAEDGGDPRQIRILGIGEGWHVPPRGAPDPKPE